MWPLDGSAPAGCSPGTRCAWAAFGSTAWSSVGLAMRHHAPGRMGGPVGPEGIPAHPGTPGVRRVQLGSKEGEEAARKGEAEEGRGGQSPARGGTVGSLSSCLLIGRTRWVRNYSRLSAGSSPGRRSEFSYRQPVGFCASFPGAGGAPNIACGSRGLVSSACPQTPGSGTSAPPFPSVPSSALFPLTCSD